MTISSDYAIEVTELKKKYGEVEALHGIDLKVEWGEFYGFLGPNGAGKSTLIQILTSLIMPTDGSAYVGGANVASDPDAVRFRIGVALQDTGVDPLLTGKELLTIQARVFGMTKKQAVARADELLQQFHLEDAANRRVKTYSGGMRRRLDLSLALVHRPGILFLDEPTTGLDPQNRLGLWELLRDINKSTGTTIFLTTQYLEEADALCDRIAIIDQGQIVAEDTPQALKRRLQQEVIELEPVNSENIDQMVDFLIQQGFVASQSKEIIRIYSQHGAHDTKLILTSLEEIGVELIGLRVTPPTLDDVFLQLTTAANDGTQRRFA